MLWRGLNAYNYCPLLAKDVPRHARAQRCPVCRVLFIGGVQGSAFGAAGETCTKCAGMGPDSPTDGSGNFGPLAGLGYPVPFFNRAGGGGGGGFF